MQQPAHPEVVSHTQVPALHRSPAAQATPAPQVQVPLAEQVSAVSPQFMHAAPDTPQVAAVRPRQLAPLQHPVHPDAPSHTHAPLVDSHRCPVTQAVHATPPFPHAPANSLVTHWPEALQHPLGHEVALHTHAPDALQSCPTTHVAFSPHLHTPEVHWLLWVASHVVQLAPPMPQVASDCPWHWFAEQHPLAHEVASHTQAPLVVLHRCPDAHALHAAPPTPQATFDST